MALRHRVKRNDRNEKHQAVVTAETRKEKIEALQKMGLQISTKANSKRVDSKFQELLSQVVTEMNKLRDIKRESNRRKRERQKRK